ncbi:MAG: hypothetical protein ACXU9D_24505, partial [Xanthobacteraceae bacterium]
MITAGFLGIFTIPGLYVLFQSWREWAKKIAAASAKKGATGRACNRESQSRGGEPVTLTRTSLPAADHGNALNLDLGVGIGQSGDGDQSAAGEIVAEYLP